MKELEKKVWSLNGHEEDCEKGSATLHKSAFPTIAGPRRILSIMLIRKIAHLNCILTVMETGWKANRAKAERQAEQEDERKAEREANASAAKASAERENLVERRAALNLRRQRLHIVCLSVSRCDSKAWGKGDQSKVGCGAQ